MNEKPRIADHISASLTRGRNTADTAGVRGHGVARIIGPDGTVKTEAPFTNLVTDIGDQVIAEALAGETPDLVTGMRLGTDNTAPAKSGAGAAIVAYVNGSAQALDATYPQTSDKGGGDGHRVTYRVTWDAGDATEDGIIEVVLTNATIADAGGSAADTVARALLSSVVNKGVDDSLEITWSVDLLGAAS